jgi:hypothetical protein
VLLEHRHRQTIQLRNGRIDRVALVVQTLRPPGPRHHQTRSVRAEVGDLQLAHLFAVGDVVQSVDLAGGQHKGPVHHALAAKIDSADRNTNSRTAAVI